LRNDLVSRGAAEEIALARLSRSIGSVLIAACQSDQYAQECAALKHGAFTEVPIQGLDGEAADKRGEISATGLETSIEQALPELTRKYRGLEQWPTG
jgi:uncharacterized caspase-like protein